MLCAREGYNLQDHIVVRTAPALLHPDDFTGKLAVGQKLSKYGILNSIVFSCLSGSMAAMTVQGAGSSLVSHRLSARHLHRSRIHQILRLLVAEYRNQNGGDEPNHDGDVK